MATDKQMLGRVQATDDGVYIFPVDKELEPDDIEMVITAHESDQHERFRKAMKYYKGDQAILDLPPKSKQRPDNRLLFNLAAYNVDTFNGFFAGIPPKISLDDEGANEALQDWQSTDNFVDKFSELSKQADVYGRSYMLVYQDENGDTHTAVVSPERAFMIYDDTVQRNQLAFVVYDYDQNNVLQGAVYTATATHTFKVKVDLSEEVAVPNIYGVVPAIEFVENEERRGINSNVTTLLDALNKAESQKANQVEYFDNAYMKIIGLDLEDDDGNVQLDLDGNNVVYAPDPGENGYDVDFIQKPDGDTMQENLINRLIEQIHQITMVPNMNDQAFSGNVSGVALEYKLLPMRNKAVTKQRKFTPSLRQLFSIIFSKNTNVLANAEAWRDLKFQFSQNIPHNLADEAETATKLEGIVSHETQLSTLSVVDDPKAEIKRMDEEKASSASAGITGIRMAMDSLTDADKAGDDNGEADE